MYKYILNKFFFNNKVANYVIYKFFYDPKINHFEKEKIKRIVDDNNKVEKEVLIKFRNKGRGFENDRYSYQKELIKFNIKENEKVLDIGSGAYPFPMATHLADLYLGDTTHRTEKIVQDCRPFIECDIEKMPFEDKEFDFVYCSHLLEHVNDPRKACEEIMRIGKRGYIETPTKASDIMFNFTKMRDHHKWFIEIRGNTLIFIEVSETEKKDMGSDYFFNEFHSLWDNPFQQYFYNNRSAFYNMFLWSEKFNYFIINKEGKILNNNE